MLQSFSLNKSIISSQDLSEVMASVINVWVNPLDLALASLDLLSFVKSAAVSISVSQSSRFVAWCPLKIAMSCSKQIVRFVWFCVVHKVFV